MFLKDLYVLSSKNEVKKIYITRGRGEKYTKGPKAGKLMGVLIGKSIFWLNKSFTNASEKNSQLNELAVQIKDDGSWVRLTNTDIENTAPITQKKAIFLIAPHEDLFCESSIHYKKTVTFEVEGSRCVRYFEPSAIKSHLTDLENINARGLMKDIKMAINTHNLKYLKYRKNHSGLSNGNLFICIPTFNGMSCIINILARSKEIGCEYSEHGGFTKKYNIDTQSFESCRLEIKNGVFREFWVKDICHTGDLEAYIKQELKGLTWQVQIDEKNTVVGEAFLTEGSLFSGECKPTE